MLRRAFEQCDNKPIDHHERSMNRKTLLSSFLPPLLEECQHKRQPHIVESKRINEPSEANKQSLSSPLNGPYCTSKNEFTLFDNDLQDIPTNFAVVSDNAKIPTTRLRERSGSLQISDDGTDDKRELSLSEIEYDGSSDVENQGRETIEGLQTEVCGVKNQIYRLQEHDRWSAHGSFSSLQGLSSTSTCMDQLPKICMRRPSL